MQKMLGLGFLVGGIILLVFGINESEGGISEIKELFTGSPTDKAVWFMVGGAAAAVLGLGLLLFGKGPKKG
jgi:uncharacterized protein DUF3185